MSTRTPSAPHAGPSPVTAAASAANPNSALNPSPSLETLQEAAAAAGAPLTLNSLEPAQILAILRHFPGVLNKLVDQGHSKEAAAETLSNLSQTAVPQQTPSQQQQQSQAPQNNAAHPQGPQQGFQQHQHQHQHQPNIHPQLQMQQGSAPPPPTQEPGPSSHPSGPPSFGLPLMEHRDNNGMTANAHPIADGGSPGSEKSAGGQSRRRGGGGAPPIMGSDEWSRLRKDNHKEVERRRRGNINEGINELARIVPNGTGEKAKGAILSRSVQYIHHLKENEARNIEKWTLEKLLMDQAMGDLQAQLEEIKRMWEEERRARERAETELRVLRDARDQEQARTGSPEGSQKRPAKDEGEQGDKDRAGAEDERGVKRPRMD